MRQDASRPSSRVRPTTAVPKSGTVLHTSPHMTRREQHSSLGFTVTIHIIFYGRDL